MSRKKKSRTPGMAPEPVAVTRNRSQADVDGREQKRLKKRKGLKAGSRHSDGTTSNHSGSGIKRDPRLGSKKKIPLIVADVKKPSKQERKVSAEKELELLENDAQLNVLLDRIESGETLGAGLQKYVDEKLDRMEALMNQLGLVLPDEDDDEDAPVDAPVAKKKVPASDDELLSQFEGINMDQFKD
ncbi:Der GTPase-activating protein YihI [Vibrio methylphosphonaticus]|uniref:Der GTPase-activating protein YihI n=1 Tax=Vibrio methylphosphonaticus TaxID=2946866 RepID=UPI00202A812F|nr:Der GTPase-activating protein YihI [Vibrio methylphosphonaticus]MCL9777325.1 Der GTPase-activating protein YihI [Vibrio methylphosphonaticus]